MNPYIEVFLQKRGYRLPEQQDAFLRYPESALRKVASMLHGETLLQTLANAVQTGKRLCVYGDYDADGIMAAFILYSGLDRLYPGHPQTNSGEETRHVQWFINHRFEDGYGITVDSMKKLLSRFPDTEVIITCDNGIGAAEAIDFAMGCGVTVLVTDHHEQGMPLREDCPVVDEKSLAQKADDQRRQQEGAFPPLREEFCGAELARRVATELYERLGLAEKEQDFLHGLYAFSGFATITDAVPMTSANHYVARRGLEIIQKQEGFWRLLEEVCGRGDRPVNTETIGFSYGPMINAAGRVTGSAEPAFRVLQLFYEGREAACRQALQELTALNETRRELCRLNDAAAARMIEEKQMQQDAFLFLCGEQFDEGVNGLTAAHLVERFHVPAAVLSPTKKDPTRYKGSARSVEGVDLFAMLAAHPEKIASGGHPMAAGLSVEAEDLDAVRQLLIEDVLTVRQGQTAEKPAVNLSSDVHFMAQELTLQAVETLQEAIQALEPFGTGLEPFRIALQGPVSRLYPLRGRDRVERHAKFIMARPAADGSRIEVLWWNHIREARERMATAREFLFIGKPEIHAYNGVRSIQFIVDELYSR